MKRPIGLRQQHETASQAERDFLGRRNVAESGGPVQVSETVATADVQHQVGIGHSAEQPVAPRPDCRSQASGAQVIAVPQALAYRHAMQRIAQGSERCPPGLLSVVEHMQIAATPLGQPVQRRPAECIDTLVTGAGAGTEQAGFKGWLHNESRDQGISLISGASRVPRSPV